MTATASATAVVTRTSMTTVGEPETIQSDNCGTGIISGTDTATYTSVRTPTGGFHFAGTDTATGRIDWSDGRYSLLGSTDHFSFNATAGTAVNTEAHTDFADNYRHIFSWLPSGPLSFPERGLWAGGLARGTALSMCHQTAPTGCR
jgi:hypothetical protein